MRGAWRNESSVPRTAYRQREPTVAERVGWMTAVPEGDWVVARPRVNPQGYPDVQF